MKKTLGVFSLSMISLSAILNLRGLPMMASLGWSSLFFYSVGLLVFLIPSSLICAELATRYPKNGGIYTWSKQAFGDKIGVMVIWMEWINNVIGFPTTLSTIVMTMVYVGLPTLPQHRIIFFLMMLVLLWSAIIYNSLGIKASSRLNIMGALLGTILPGTLIILIGACFIYKNHGFPQPISPAVFFPKININSMAVLVGVLSAYAGMQVTAFHASDVKNPKKDYPKAFGITTLLIFIISSCSVIAIFELLPAGKVNLLNGVIQSFAAFFALAHLPWFTPLLAFFIAFGSIASLSAWLIGPARGLREMLKEHNMYPLLSRLNKHDMPFGILILQGIIATFFASLFFWMPDFQSSFWLLMALTSQFTVLMYIFLFAAFIRLRFKEKEKNPSAFYVPGGMLAAIVLCSVAILASVIAFFLGLFPPATLSLPLQQNLHYIAIMIIGDVAILSLPFLLFKKLRERKSVIQNMTQESAL